MPSNTTDGKYRENARSVPRYNKRFSEKFAHTIEAYLPLLPSNVQTHFLICQILALTGLAFVFILIAGRFDREVITYFRDLSKKLRVCGRRTETLEEGVADLVEKPMAFSKLVHGNQSIFGTVRKRNFSIFQNHNASLGGSGGASFLRGGKGEEIYETYPSKSKYKNFSRQRNILKLHLPFAHDLTSFIAMVDGDM